MPEVYYGNFDFEHELASPSQVRSSRRGRLNAELTTHLLALASDRDYLFYPCEPPAQFLADAARSGFPDVSTESPNGQTLETSSMVPWGWSKSSVEFARDRGWKCPVDPLVAVAETNSRKFSSNLEQHRRCGLPGATPITSLESVEAAIEQAASLWRCRTAEFRWLIKSEFTMSGRERLAGSGAVLNESTRHWIRRRLSSTKQVYLEPCVTSLCELSTQWQLPDPAFDSTLSAEPELVGATRLLTDRVGQYLGSVPVAPSMIDASPEVLASRESGPACSISVEDSEETFSWSTTAAGAFDSSLLHGLLNHAVDVVRSAVREVQRLGYHGPLGIDAMIYLGPDNQPAVRPLQDINARFTMGRIALEWFRKFPSAGCPAWLLVPAGWVRGDARNSSSGNSTFRLTSPFEIAGEPASRVGLLIQNQADWMTLLDSHLRP